MADRRLLSPAQRKARRERVRRRAARREAQRRAEGDILTLERHGRSYKLYDPTGLDAGKAASKIANCMKAGKPYEQPLLEYIRAQGFTGTAVDVGAHVGNHTLWMAVMCDLHVVAFEPLLADQLRANVKLNRLDDSVTVYPCALYDGTGYAAHIGQGQLHIRGDGRIRVRRLDDFELEGVAVIKVDVEGLEAGVLRGAEQTIRRCRPVIFAEEWASDPSWHNGIAAVLEPLGYEMTRRFYGKGQATPVGRWDPIP